MADNNELFHVLDDGNGLGEGIRKIQEGDTGAAKNGSLGFAFKDASGNVILPQLTAEGKLPVDTEATGGTCLSERGENAGSLTAVDICTMTLQLSKLYTGIGIVASCLQSTLFQVVHIDDVGGTPTETILFEAIVGAGAYTVCCEPKCMQFNTTGGTGTQNFVLRGTNLKKESTMRGALTANEGL